MKWQHYKPTPTPEAVTACCLRLTNFAEASKHSRAFFGAVQMNAALSVLIIVGVDYT